MPLTFTQDEIENLAQGLTMMLDKGMGPDGRDRPYGNMR